MTELPEDLSDAIFLLNQAEKRTDFQYRISCLYEVLEDLAGYETNYPEHEKYISNILNAHTRRLFYALREHKPDLEWFVWLQMLLILCGTMKWQTKIIIKNDPAMRKYLEDLFFVHAETEPITIRRLISEMFDEES